jgi:hypothetical protein
MHQPVIIAVAYVVVQWQASVAVKAAAIFAVSAVATAAAAELLRRLPVVGPIVAPASRPANATGLTMRDAGPRPALSGPKGAHRAP